MKKNPTLSISWHNAYRLRLTIICFSKQFLALWNKNILAEFLEKHTCKITFGKIASLTMRKKGLSGL